MKTTYRDYPYPVLAFFNDDYKNKSFTTNVSVSNTDNILYLNIDFNLNSTTLQNLLDSNKATFLVHLECRRTRFRNTYETTNNQIEIPIDKDKVNGQVEIVMSIVSKSIIDNFSSNEFNDYFYNTTFKIEPGDILAIAMDQVLTVKKIDDGLKKSSSLFNITLSDNEDPLTWDIDDSSILVKLPKKTYEMYRNLIASSQAQNILTSIIVVPILTEIFTELKLNPNQYDDCDEFVNSLNLILKNINMEISDLKTKDVCISNTVYSLINNLLPQSFCDLEYLLINGGD